MFSEEVWDKKWRCRCWNLEQKADWWCLQFIWVKQHLRRQRMVALLGHDLSFLFAHQWLLQILKMSFRKRNHVPLILPNLLYKILYDDIITRLLKTMYYKVPLTCLQDEWQWRNISGRNMEIDAGDFYNRSVSVLKAVSRGVYSIWC